MAEAAWQRGEKRRERRWRLPGNGGRGEGKGAQFVLGMGPVCTGMGLGGPVRTGMGSIHTGKGLRVSVCTGNGPSLYWDEAGEPSSYWERAAGPSLSWGQSQFELGCSWEPWFVLGKFPVCSGMGPVHTGKGMGVPVCTGVGPIHTGKGLRVPVHNGKGLGVPV